MQLPVVRLEYSIVLSVTKNNVSGSAMVKHMKNRVRYDYEHSMESFPRRWQQRRELLLILVILKKCHLSGGRQSLLVRITHQPG